MPLINPFLGHSGMPTFADSRRALEGLVARSATGVMRAGIFPDHLNPIVTGQTSMRVAIGDFRAVQNRGGAVFLANVGTDTSVILDAAPAANRRIDLIYVTMRSTTLGDTANTATFGVVKGTAAATPTVPSLPANAATAIPLATVEIPAGATTTLSAGVIITQVYPYTSEAGGTVPVRNTVELAAWTPAEGSRAFCIADAADYVRIGGGWQREKVTGKASTGLIATGGFQSIPVVFPANSFLVAPALSLTPSSWRLNVAYGSLTAAGFTISVNNWSSGPAAAAEVQWTAVPA